MKPTKQTVYLPVSEFNSSERAICTIGIPDLYGDKVIEEQGYFFTPEELNEYTANVIKQALKVAVENVEIHSVTNHSLARDFEYAIESGRIWVPSNSITNAFDKTYKEFEV